MPLSDCLSVCLPEQVIINERAVRGVSIVNGGAVAFDFVWDVGTNPRVTVKPEGGSVRKGERTTCELTYHPHGPDRLKDYKVGMSACVRFVYVFVSPHLRGLGPEQTRDIRTDYFSQPYASSRALIGAQRRTDCQMD